MTQQERVLSFLCLKGKVTTNELKNWGWNEAMPKIGNVDRRMRELVAEGDLKEYGMAGRYIASRPMTDNEMEAYNYKTRVNIYVLECSKPQLNLAM